MRRARIRSGARVRVPSRRRGVLVRFDGPLAIVRLDAPYDQTSLWPDGCHRYTRDAVRPDKPRRKRPNKPQGPQWTNRDNIAASRQGWAIFECSSLVLDEGFTDPRLLRDNEVNAFPDDDAACRFVVRTSEHGNALAARALAYLAAKFPQEHGIVMRCAEGK